MQTRNPATGKPIKVYEEHSLSQIDGILKEADKAFQSWRRLGFKERAGQMQNAAKVLIKNKENYARLMAEEMGKPLAQGKGEIEKCASVCEYYARQAEKYLAPEYIETEASRSFVVFEPLGIVFAIMPWNFPFWQVFRCAVPSLMAGNAVVLKHAANVCGCALALEEIFKEAGFPKGLFSNIFVRNEAAGAVIEHPLVQAVALTGSTRAGKSVGARAGAMIKKTVLELGGSDPYIVLEDADLEKAAQTCAASRLINGGQSCISAKRFIVVEAVFEKFQIKFIEQMSAQHMGHPLEEGVTLGPMARHDLRDQLHAQVVNSVKKGARLILGGNIPVGPGAFYHPTVLTDLAPGMPAYDEELFGPVASLIQARDEHEAIAIANNSIFGLGAAIFTTDIERAQRIAIHELQVGSCFINDYVKSDPRLPFGGIKQSGHGRELSSFGIREFVNIKTIYIK